MNNREKVLVLVFAAIVVGSFIYLQFCLFEIWYPEAVQVEYSAPIVVVTCGELSLNRTYSLSVDVEWDTVNYGYGGSSGYWHYLKEFSATLGITYYFNLTSRLTQEVMGFQITFEVISIHASLFFESVLLAESILEV